MALTRFLTFEVLLLSLVVSEVWMMDLTRLLT